MRSFRSVERTSAPFSDIPSSRSVQDLGATGVWFWHNVAQGDLSGRSALIHRLMRFPVPNTFIVDPKQSVTGIVYRNKHAEIIRDMSPDAVLQYFAPDAVEQQQPVAVVQRPVGQTETSTTFMDGQTLTQFVRRIHDSDDASILCVQEYVPSRTAHQFVRMTCTGSSWCGQVMSRTSPRVFKLASSAIDGELRKLVESV